MIIRSREFMTLFVLWNANNGFWVPYYDLTSSLLYTLFLLRSWDHLHLRLRTSHIVVPTNWILTQERTKDKTEKRILMHNSESLLIISTYNLLPYLTYLSAQYNTTIRHDTRGETQDEVQVPKTVIYLYAKLETANVWKHEKSMHRAKRVSRWDMAGERE